MSLKRLAWVLVLLGLSLAPASMAGAHSYVVRSEPADGSALEASPPQVRLWFSEAFVPGFSTARVLDQNGDPIPLVSQEVDPSDPTLMILTLPPLEPGVYSVNWNAVSAVDGHAGQGYIVFSLGGAAIPQGAPAGGAETGQSVSNPIEVLLRGLNYLCLIVSVGCIGVLLWVLPAEAPPTDAALDFEPAYRSARRRVLLAGLAGSATAVIIGLGQLAWQVNKLAAAAAAGGQTTGPAAGQIAAGQIAAKLITQTPWGNAWAARMILLAVVTAVLWRQVQAGQPGWGALTLALAGLGGALVAQSFVSHAAGVEQNLVPVAINAAHIFTAGLWIGGLGALALGLLPIWWQDPAAFSLSVRRCWAPFSLLAALSVGLVIASGVYNTGREVISADALLLDPYGKILAAKIALVALAGLVGLANSSLLHPRLAAPLARWLGKPPGWTPLHPAQFPRLVLVECALGLLIVLLVGVLTSIPPAKNLAYAFSPGDQPDSVSRGDDDLLVTLAIRPNHPGANLFDIQVLNSRRPAPAETLRLIVRMTYLDQAFGTTTQDAELAASDGWADHYRLASNQLTQPGRWAVEIVVRRKGLPDATVMIPWTVLPATDAGPRLVSRTPWQSELALAAGALAIATILLAGLVYVQPRRKSRNT